MGHTIDVIHAHPCSSGHSARGSWLSGRDLSFGMRGPDHIAHVLARSPLFKSLKGHLAGELPSDRSSEYSF